jgi:putative serine protease PepD
MTTPFSAPEPTPEHASAPVPQQRRRRSRTGALLVVGALACSTTGAGTALLVDRSSSTPSVSAAAPASTLTRSLGTVTAAATSTTGTPETAAATIAPSVVTISVSGTTQGSFGQSQQVQGTGSGIVLRTDGYILTNNHVVSAAGTGGSVTVTFTSGKTVPARVVGTDPTSDLAVVKVSGVSGLVAATFADSDALKVGQAVLAVGAPLGLSNTVTEGIVSTLHRPVRTGEQGASEQSVIDAVQTDAAINPGNSGGALVDLAGRVVGINSAIATSGDGTSGNIGVGFAIASDDATKVADQLIASGKATHPQLGVGVTDGGTDGAGGAQLTAVTAGGPAAQAGLKAGDVVTQVGTRRTPDADSLIVAVREQSVGADVQLTYTRGGTSHTATVTLGTAAS